MSPLQTLIFFAFSSPWVLPLLFNSLFLLCSLSMPRKLPFLFSHLCSRGVPGILALDLLPNQQPVGSCLSLWSRKPLLLPAPTDWRQLSLISTSWLQPGAHSLRLHIAVSWWGGWWSHFSCSGGLRKQALLHHQVPRKTKLQDKNRPSLYSFFLLPF